MAEHDREPPPDPAVLEAAGKALEDSDLGLQLVVSHCSTASIANSPTWLKYIAEQGTLEPKIPEPGKDDPDFFEFEEHRFLGNALILPGHDTLEKDGNRSAANNPFTLPNGLVVTYGQINGLAGDFFAATDPICLGKGPEGRKKNFQTAFKTLSEGAANKRKAEDLLKALQLEVDAIDKALREQEKDPDFEISKAYKELQDQTFELDQITKDAKASGLTYLELAKKNLDHFGANARLAYNTGHAWALEVAKQGTLESLLEAYTINAFADHFLEDSFAGGHFRVPREHLIDGFFQQAMAKLMHDEDNRLGIFVSGPSIEKGWTAYGDKRLFDPEDKTNFNQLFRALNDSVQEVHKFNQNPNLEINEVEFKAWQWAPTLDSEKAVDGNFAPLLMVKDGVVNVRSNISKTVDLSDRVELSTPEEWNSYRPIDGWIKTSIPIVGTVWIPVPVEAHWAYLAYVLAPAGEIKKEALAWLKAQYEWLLKELGIGE